MFSTDVSPIARELRGMLTFYMTHIGSPSVSDFLFPSWIPNVLSARRAIFRRKWRNLLASTIEQRRRACANAAASKQNLDLFDLLEQAHGDRSDDLLSDGVSTILVAGRETTALTLFWACSLLARAPDVQAELAAEAGGFAWRTDDNAAVQSPKLSDLPLMRSFVQETLRLYSPAFMTARRALKDHSICGSTVGVGSMILIPLWMLHRNPNVWPSAECFDPWRFTSPTPPGRFDYLPFGVGPHVCIGAQLAPTEVTIVLSRLLRDNWINQLGSEIPLPVGRLSTRPSFSPSFTIRKRESATSGR